MEVNQKVELLNKWLLHTTRKANAHASCAHRSRRWRQAIGIPSVVLSAIVGTAVFSELETTGGIGHGLVIALVLCSAVLTALQTFFNYGEVEQVHRVAHKKYSKIRRRIDKSLTGLSATSDDDLVAIEKELDEASEIEPIISDKEWHKVEIKFPTIS